MRARLDHVNGFKETGVVITFVEDVGGDDINDRDEAWTPAPQFAATTLNNTAAPNSARLLLIHEHDTTN